MSNSVNMNTLYYGDNLEVLRRDIKDETVDLCYIDPPFNSKRNYNQIYNNIGSEDRAQAQAFIDTWIWDERANEGLVEILANDTKRFSVQTVDLLKGLLSVLRKGSLLAYLISITLRVAEIHRVLKPTGSLYLHCDPTASHYLKIILDTIFVAQGGDFQNEIVWCYTSGGKSKTHFARKHDVLFFYTKSSNYTFNVDKVRIPYSPKTLQNYKPGLKGSSYTDDVKLNDAGKVPEDYWNIAIASKSTIEYLGYPTQKPMALLDRIIQASSNEGDVILDAYCGCGTTVSAAENLKRSWIGIDITFQSISLVLRRLEGQFGKEISSRVILDGIPKDMASAEALALKKDDRVRKEFEKWALLTYSNDRAIINDKKGADQGIDGTAFFLTNRDENAKVVFQAKSGNVKRDDIAKFNSDRLREGAEIGIFITLKSPTKPMRDEANAVGVYQHSLMGRSYSRIQIVTIAEIIEQKKRLDIPLSREVLKYAQTVTAQGNTIAMQDLIEE